jgi:immunoglobulin-binding protein 1
MSDSSSLLTDIPLRQLFQQAETTLQQLDTILPSHPDATNLQKHAQLLLARATTACDTLAIFSPNESSIDDISTADLKYFLIPYMRAHTTSSHTVMDPIERRTTHLSVAVSLYQSFLRLAHQYRLVDKHLFPLLHRALMSENNREEDDDDDSSSSSNRRRRGVDTSSSSISSSSSRSRDPTVLRQQKIEKFKREKELKKRLDSFQPLVPRIRGMHITNKGDDDNDEEDSIEDEIVRKYWITRIQLAVSDVLGEVPTLQQEIELLKHRASLPTGGDKEDTRSSSNKKIEDGDFLEKLAQAASALQKSTLSSSSGNNSRQRRQDIRSEVFRPSHTVATMSVEQYGEVEYRQMMERQRVEEDRKEVEERRRMGMTEEEREEEEVGKQRAWDAFKDDNPRGWGNSKLRPCA